MAPSLYENKMVWPKMNDQNEMAPSLYETNGMTNQMNDQPNAKQEDIMDTKNEARNFQTNH